MNAKRTLKLFLCAGVLAWTAGVERAAAQTPPTIAINVSNAVRISAAGTNGQVCVIQSSGTPALSNSWGSVGFLQISSSNLNLVDPSAIAPARFYRALVLNPSNMVFVAPNTFVLGSPTNEQERSLDESPQTTVTLSRGYWIGKFLVTQAEYLDLIGVNPSDFKGDLNRPVESVSWGQASNYCVQLTQRELAAGRIPPGAHYRLPTEAEWECAARAGTTTRFYYGDDPTYAGLADHAWYGALNGITTHPVGQKLPNPWGLYDMAGNLLEWCQDWYGPYPGGAVTDPQGPASNQFSAKVTRGGAWDAFQSDCRSARRQFQGAPFNVDDTIGFRVVLAIDP